MVDYATLFDSQPSPADLRHAFDGVEADITYIDNTDTVRYFSPFRIFERPSSCLEQNVYDCHPDEVHDALSALLDGFRSGQRDTVTFDGVRKGARTVKVCYHAMRDPDGVYLGCMEVATYRDER